MITVTQTTFETSNIKCSSTCSISCCFCKCSSNSATATTTTPLISSSSTVVVAVAIVIMAVVVVLIDSNLIFFIYLFIESRHSLHKYSSFYHFSPLNHLSESAFCICMQLSPCDVSASEWSEHRNSFFFFFFWRSVKIKSSTSKYPRRMSFESGIQVELKTVQ